MGPTLEFVVCGLWRHSRGGWFLHACGRGWALDVQWWKERHCGQQRGCVPTGGWWVIDVLCNYFIMFQSCDLQSESSVTAVPIGLTFWCCRYGLQSSNVWRELGFVSFFSADFIKYCCCCATSNDCDIRRKTPLSKSVSWSVKSRTSCI